MCNVSVCCFPSLDCKLDRIKVANKTAHRIRICVSYLSSCVRAQKYVGILRLSLVSRSERLQGDIALRAFSEKFHSSVNEINESKSKKRALTFQKQMLMTKTYTKRESFYINANLCLSLLWNNNCDIYIKLMRKRIGVKKLFFYFETQLAR